MRREERPRSGARGSWRIAAIALLLTGLPALAAGSQDAGSEAGDGAAPMIEDEIVVSANRHEAPRSEIGSSVTVLDAEEIEARNQVTVLDLLRTVPGVEVTRTGGPGKATTVRVRGGEGDHVLVLLDGVRMNTVTEGTFNFANLLASNVERIEVLRGPQATWGSEAMSGVISVITGRGESDWRLHALGEGGSDSHRRFDLGLQGGTGRWHYSAGATDLSTGGVSHRVIPGGAMEDDPFENRTWSVRADAGFLDDGRVDLRVRSSRGDTALDGFGAEDLNAMASTDDRTMVVSVEKDLASFWRQTVRVGQTDGDLLGIDPDTIWNNYDIRSTLRQVDLQSDVQLGQRNLLNVGYSTETREGLSQGSYDVDANINSWFVQDQWAAGDSVHVTAAVRGDEHSVLGSRTSHRVTVAAGWGEGRGRVHGSFGTAFRAPNFGELFSPCCGNVSLLPETTEGFDIGVEQRFGDSGVSVDLTWFDQKFDQWIDFDFSTYSYRNVANAASSGVEFTLGYRPNLDWRLELSHTYNDTEDMATGAQLVRRPQNRTAFVAHLRPTERLAAAVMAARVADRIEFTGDPMDDYLKVDVHLSWWRSIWQPFVRLENALDEDYFEVPGFVTPGRTVIAGVRLQPRRSR